MAVDTATIRVTRQTRDLLAAQARARGLSLAAMLEQLAREAAREAMFRSERDAARADAGDPGARDDERAWGAALIATALSVLFFQVALRVERWGRARAGHADRAAGSEHQNPARRGRAVERGIDRHLL